MNESDVSLFDFLDHRLQVKRTRGIIGIGIIFLISHFQYGAIKTVNEIVHFTRLVARSVCLVEPA